MKIDPSFSKDLRLISPYLKAVWNSLLDRYQILYQDERLRQLGTVKIICTVEDDEGNFRPLDRRLIIWLSTNVCWDLLHQYPEPQDMYHHMKEKQMRAKKKTKENRTDYRKWWNKDHRTEWRAAFENARRGIMGRPEEIKKTIHVQVPRRFAGGLVIGGSK